MNDNGVEFLQQYFGSRGPNASCLNACVCVLREEPMVPEEHEEVNMNEYDPTTRRQRTMSEDDEDQMHGHGPGVSCATQ